MLKSVFVAMLALSGSVKAAILVSNLAEPIRATTTIEASLWALQSFSTDNNSYSLTNIMTVLGSASGSPLVVAELRAGDTGTGTLLATFAVPSLLGPQSVMTLTPNSAVILDPNSTYSLILGVMGAGSFGWTYAEGNNWIGPGALGIFGYSTDQGLTWGAFDFDNPYMVQVNVAGPIPEPSALVLSATALLVVAALFRRRLVKSA